MKNRLYLPILTPIFPFRLNLTQGWENITTGEKSFLFPLWHLGAGNVSGGLARVCNPCLLSAHGTKYAKRNRGLHNLCDVVELAGGSRNESACHQLWEVDGGDVECGRRGQAGHDQDTGTHGGWTGEGIRDRHAA